MTTRKIRLGLVFGGKSAEHEVSLMSAKNIFAGLDKQKYDILLIGIDKKGEWHVKEASSFLLNADSAEHVKLGASQQSIALMPRSDSQRLVGYSGSALQSALDVDVLFPILHGSQGEDGTLQGLLKLLDIPFVGAGVLGSAVGMDKDVMKRLLRDAGIPVGKFLTVRAGNQSTFSFEHVAAALGLPFFVKPANAGSSVGICKVKSKADYDKALADAFLYDRKVICEEFIEGRELECSVLGNDHPVASVPGEIIPHHEFYSYEAKYLDPEGATFHIPAQVSAACVQQLQQIALDAYQVLCCEGMARIDFFLKADGSLLVNEINTLPGFTKISMYPKLWEASGLGYAELLDRLVALAMERHAKEVALKTSFF
jgi:D-alanine-D-alanine ligase